MIEKDQYLLVTADGIKLVSSAKEARDKAKGKALLYSLQLVMEVGYNKAVQPKQETPKEPEPEVIDETPIIESDTPKKRGRPSSK